MPTPVAHGLAGAITVAALSRAESDQRDWRLLLVGAVLGVIPDLDVLLVLITNDLTWHHDFSHSFGFALLAGWLAAVWLKEKDRRILWVCGAAMATHPLLDFSFTEASGVELFWPLADERFRLAAHSFTIYRLNPHSHAERVQLLLLIALIELLIYGSLLLIVLMIRNRRKRFFLSGSNR